MSCSQFKPERSLYGLEPSFKRKALLFLFLCPQIFVTETTRSKERQECLVKNGFSRVAQSLHQDGQAIDIAFLGDDLYPWSNKAWETIADVAYRCGIDWGYELWNWDKPHFQDSERPITIKSDTLHDYFKIASEEVAPLDRVFQEYNGNDYIKEKDVKLLIEIAVNRAKLGK